MRVERTLAYAEYVAALAADDLPDEFTAMARATNDLLDWRAILRKRQDRGIGLLATKVTLILDALCTGEKIGVDRRCAMAVRIWRMDLRPASRKARLAFSMRCQRSATCVALGNALAAASPYPPPRSLATTPTSGWPTSQACAVACSRSGRSGTGRRRSRSQTIVP